MTEPLFTVDGEIVEIPQPLGLPQGSVRAILALTLGVGVIVALIVFALLFEEQRDIIVGALIVAAAGVREAYFKARANGSN